MKVLVYGSTYLTAKTCKRLLAEGYSLVGHIPNAKPCTVPGQVPLPVVKDNIKHDIKLSIQYDNNIADITNAYNIHTGLLPQWGRVDILYHTLRAGVNKQGLTFHKMGLAFDYGPIICQTTYPVFPDDKIEDLYERLVLICPLFTLTFLRILETIGLDRIGSCFQAKPTLYRRGHILPEDIKMYRQTKNVLQRKFK